jgi:hypothetical protein
MSPLARVSHRPLRRFALAACLLAVTLFAAGAGAQATFTSLYQFSGTDGSQPSGTLIADGNGNLFGTTQSGGAFNAGAVYELVNDGNGSYTEKTLYSFTGASDGDTPVAGVVMDSAGNLFGTTSAGGGIGSFGVAFELANNGNGTYTEKTLYSFTGAGLYPNGGVTLDSHDNLFGSTYENTSTTNGGLVYELVNSGNGNYSEVTLYQFSGGNDGGNAYGAVTLDSQGNIFGTTQTGGPSNAGVVYELVNNGNGSYTDKTLYSFSGASDGGYPAAGVTLDSSGNVFGTTGTTVFELINGNGSYSEQTLYTFTSGSDGSEPTSGVSLDANGDLFGNTYAAIFELVNNGGGSYTEKTLQSLTAYSGGQTFQFQAGAIYNGAIQQANGTVWELALAAGSPPATTSLTLTTSANPVFVGQNTTLTASLSSTPSSLSISGTVTFKEGSTVLGTATVANDQASITVTGSTLPLGSDTISAEYTPSGAFTGSSGSVIETVDSAAGLATLSGGNTFNGNQTVNGTVSATEFVGNLTGNATTATTAMSLNCTGCVTANQLSVSYAAGDAQAGNALYALNAGALGGLLPNAFALAGASNTFTGDQTINGNLLTTGNFRGATGNFTGSVTSNGLNLGPTGTATALNGYSSGPLTTTVSVFNGSTNAAQTFDFLWQAEPANNGSSSPSATLNLLYAGNGAPAETGISVNSSGLLTAPAFSGDGSQLLHVTAASAGTLTGDITESQVTNLSTDLANGISTSEAFATTAANNAETGAVSTAETYANTLAGTAESGAVTTAENFATAKFVPLAGGTMTGALNLPSLAATGGVTATGPLAGGSLSVGGGTPITEYLSVTLPITLPAMKPGTCTTFQTAALTGFTPGDTDTISLGIPSALQTGLTNGPDGPRGDRADGHGPGGDGRGAGPSIFLAFQAWETPNSSPTTVTLQVCNPSSPYSGGATGTIRFDIFKH